MDIKFKKKEFIHIGFFVFYVAFYLLLLINFTMGTSESAIRYYMLFVGVILGFLALIKKYRFEIFRKTKFNDLLLMIILGLWFLIHSIIIAKSNNGVIMFRTFTQIFLMISPALYAFILLNLLEKKSIYKLLKCLFVLSILLYFCEAGHRPLDFLNFSNYSTLFTGHSFSESNLFSEVFLQLFLLFNYFVNINKDPDSKLSKTHVLIAGGFAILCGKRLALLMVLVIPFINFIFKRRSKKPVNTFMFLLVIFLFVFATNIYMLALEHKILTQFDIFTFSSGRDYILSLWAKYDYVSYGYGSSLLLIGRYLELDLVQILLELNVFSLILFCFVFLKTSKKSFYGFCIMGYSMLNMLTASSLPYSLGWIIIFIALKLIENHENLNKVCETSKSDE